MTAEPAGPSSAAALETLTSYLTELRDGQDGLTSFIEQMVDELETVRGQLDQCQRERDSDEQEHRRQCDELRQRREQLAAAGVAPAKEIQAEWDGQRTALAEEIETLRRQAAEWNEERKVLEQELETVRGRAADMTQTLAEQKKQIAEERAEWTGELKNLRRVLERQAESLAHRAQAAQPAAAAVARPAEPMTSGKPADPVLGSVMAQFEHLQRDLQRRRQTS